jgi:hypothetical protein
MAGNRLLWCYVEKGGCGRKQVKPVIHYSTNQRKTIFECLECGKKYRKHPDFKPHKTIQSTKWLKPVVY